MNMKIDNNILKKLLLTPRRKLRPRDRPRRMQIPVREPDTFDSYYQYIEWVSIHTGTHVSLHWR